MYSAFSEFDQVSVKKSMVKIEAVVVCTINLSFIREFITGRTYQVKDQFSDVFSALGGVSQGGVLSPILFLLYTYELPNYITNSGHL